MGKQGAEDFIGLVRASRLVDDAALDRGLAESQQQTGGTPLTSAAEVAAYFVKKGLLTQWQSDRLREGKYKGFYLGRYKLLDHLGVGKMSSVYLAEHVVHKHRVAIKIIPPKAMPRSATDRTSFLEQVYREARHAAVLNHQNIVRVYDGDISGDVCFIVVEYVDGETLESIVGQRGSLDCAVAVDYICQAARGLSHVHQHLLIHRDVKPTNLLVDRQNVVKVLVFALSNFFDEVDGKTPLIVHYRQNVLSAADYLAPEQSRESHYIDARADIYSLGCTLYYLLTGQPPFPDGTLPQRILSHQREIPPDIRQKRRDIPADLAAICTRMMAKKLEERFQSMDEVVAVLTHWLVDHGHEPPDDFCPSGVPR